MIYYTVSMRPLSEDETQLVIKKLSKYMGDNVKQMLEREDQPHVFRLHRNRVFYCSEILCRKAQHFARKNLVSFGTCIGKFTHSGKFRLQVTALDYMARLARYKVWVKNSGEQSFLYGNHVLKAQLKRVTSDTPNNAGVVILNENDLPLGFGTMAKSALDTEKAGTEQILVYHQSDIGQYLRNEVDLI